MNEKEIIAKTLKEVKGAFIVEIFSNEWCDDWKLSTVASVINNVINSVAKEHDVEVQ